MIVAGIKLRWRPWMFGYVAAVAMWLATIAYSEGRGGFESLSVALAFGAFSVLVAIGQMLVIASGPGNIDLSVPSVLTLSAYISMGVIHGSDGRLVLGLAAALTVGLAAGALNYLAILFIRIPPIIATLASSFIFQSLAMNFGGEATIKPPRALAEFTVARLGFVQVLPLTALVVSIIAGLVVSRTVFGRRLLATGQNESAARLAGISVNRVRLIAYAGCGVLAALTGFLLSGFTGGAALNMGDAYLMESIAVVVLGGTSVAGGQANAYGIWGSALFFNLLTTMLNTFHIGAGIRFVLTGLIIVAIIAIATRPDRT
jgi:ribose transport system permease protein